MLTPPYLETPLPKKSTHVATAGVETGNAVSTDNAAQIMQKYNLHHISYAEVTDMMMEMQKAGAIPGGNLLELDDHGKNDFLERIDNHLAYVEKNQASDFSTIFQARRMADFFHNLDALAT